CKASATVKADVRSVVMKMTREEFRDFLEKHPQGGLILLEGLAAHLARRLRKASDKLIRQAETALAIYDWD
ncbi:MAG: hypothetical protein AAF514_10660, partial [Verrucomicrobiota bacterium]